MTLTFKKLASLALLLFSLTSCQQEKLIFPDQLKTQERKALLNFAFSELEEILKIQPQVTNKPKIPSADQAQISVLNYSFNKLFVSLYAENKLKGCMSADSTDQYKTDLPGNLKSALRRAVRDKRFGKSFSPEDLSKASISIDFLYNPQELRLPKERNLNHISEKIELGIHAVQISQGKQKAFFKASVPITKNYSHAQMLERLCLKAKLNPTCYLEPNTQIRKYDSLTLWSDRNVVRHLIRENPELKASQITQSMIEKQLKSSVAWIESNLEPNTGLQPYEYLPSQDNYTDSRNHVRQLASLWIYLKTKNFLSKLERERNGETQEAAKPKPEAVEKALKANNAVTDKVKEKPKMLSPKLLRDTLQFYQENCVWQNDIAYYKIDGKTKLSYNAFVILALLEAPEYPNSLNQSKALATAILRSQNQSGSYNTSYGTQDYLSGINFYSGQMMLALMGMYNATKDKIYLESVKRAFPFYRDYWRNNPSTAAIPWLTQSFYLLYRETDSVEVAEFIFEMNDWLLKNHYDRAPQYSDLLGGMPHKHPTNSTACWLEGVNDAYDLARSLNDQKHVESYAEALKNGSKFILLSQFTGENSFYLKNPKRAIGGFRHSITKNNLRNDFTQHACAELMKVYTNKIFANNHS